MVYNEYIKQLINSLRFLRGKQVMKMTWQKIEASISNGGILAFLGNFDFIGMTDNEQIFREGMGDIIINLFAEEQQAEAKFLAEVRDDICAFGDTLDFVNSNYDDSDTLGERKLTLESLMEKFNLLVNPDLFTVTREVILKDFLGDETYSTRTILEDVSLGQVKRFGLNIDEHWRFEYIVFNETTEEHLRLTEWLEEVV